MRKLVTAILIFITTTANAQFYGGTAQGEAMAGATATLCGIDAVHYNIAGTAYSPAGVTAGYHNRYFLKELSQKNIGAAAPALKGVFSLSVNYFGYRLYNSTKADFGYAMKLGKHVAAGVRIGWLNLHISESPEKNNTFDCEAGIIYSPTESWKIGASIANPSNSQFQNCDTVIPVSMRTAVSYLFTKDSEVTAEVERNSLTGGFITKFGIRYAIYKGVDLMCGVSNKPLTIALGAGYTLGNCRVDIAFRHQEILGWMPSVSARWCFNDKKPQSL